MMEETITQNHENLNTSTIVHLKESILIPSHTLCLQAGFLEKNNDALHESLVIMVQESTDSFVKSLFPQVPVNNSSKRLSKKLTVDSVGKKFKVSVGIVW